MTINDPEWEALKEKAWAGWRSAPEPPAPEQRPITRSESVQPRTYTLHTETEATPGPATLDLNTCPVGRCDTRPGHTYGQAFVLREGDVICRRHWNYVSRFRQKDLAIALKSRNAKTLREELDLAIREARSNDKQMWPNGPEHRGDS